MAKPQPNLRQQFIYFVEGLSLGQKRSIWYLSDLFSFVSAALVTNIIFYEMIILSLEYYIIHLLLSFFVYNLISAFMRIRSRINRYINITDLGALFFIVFFSSVLSGLITSLFLDSNSARYTFVMGGIAALIIVGFRFLWQVIYLGGNHLSSPELNGQEKRENIVLIGAGDGGSLYMSSYRRQPLGTKVIAIVDDDPAKVGRNIGGVKVVGNLDKLEELNQQYDISKAVVAIPSLGPEKYDEILQRCNELNIKVYKMPPVEDVLLGLYQPSGQMREINISDLLGRKEVDLDESSMRQELEGKTILITGAGGSIGSEIVRQVSKYSPSKILLLGHGENSIYLIYHEMIHHNKRTIQYVPIILDVQDYKGLVNVFKREAPDIVYHAAAHKHVPLMESNPAEAFKNNILGTYNVARAVDEAGVPKMVMISTDKAVNPPNVMGASKRVAELIITGMNKISNSTYCAVRFGNVLGSRGSVVPAFKKQIKEGGPVEVTDFRMTRYFMTIPEASRLVVYAGSFAHGGEVFILDMGEPVKILDLAKKVILLSGHTVEEVGIVESGIRPGEKLYEELLTGSELIENQLNDQIFIGKVTNTPLEDTLQFVEELKSLVDEPRLLKESIIQFANESTK